MSDCINFSGLSEQVVPTFVHDPEQIALSLLPTPEDDKAICNMCTFISHIMYDNMEFAKLTFDGVVNWHITHDFYEMSTKSVVVSIS